MKPEHEKYILENSAKKSAKTIANTLGLKERKVRKILEEARKTPVKTGGMSVVRSAVATPWFADKLSMATAVIIIVALTAIVFIPALFNQFVNWDDVDYVVNNNVIKYPTLDNIKSIFTSSFVSTYCPLVIMSYAIEYRVFGLNPFGYHLTNYFLNILVTISVFAFIYLISRKVNVAFIASILFGIHPMHVESVAWISERKDLLFTLFYILSLIAYQYYIKNRALRYYTLCFLSALLSLLSKPMAVTIPFTLLLVDYISDRKMDISVVLEKTPFFAVAFIFGVINFYFQAVSGATGLAADIVTKIYFLLKSIPFYLSKLAIPVNLSAIYFYHNTSPDDIGEMALNAILLIMISAAVIFSGKYSKKVIFGSAFFLITIMPVLKIIPVGDAFAADRYIYLPSIGFFYIISIGIFYIMSGRTRLPGFAVRAMSFIVILYAVWLSALTWERCGIWKSTDSLFFDVAKQNPENALVNNNIGAIYLRQGNFKKAIPYFEKALTENPSQEMLEMIQWNLGLARKNMNRYEK